MKPQLIVVEGLHDMQRIREIYPQIPVVVTQGSAIDQTIIEQLKLHEKTHEIVLFLDPDHAGNRIRRILSNALTQATHAFLDPEAARSKNKKKIGIEHASKEQIEKALNRIRIEFNDTKSDVDFSFLYTCGLIGQLDSKKKRETVTKALNIGHANGKTLLYKIHRFNIMRQNIIEVLK